MSVAVFSYATFTALFPAFGVGGAYFITDPQACAYFGMASLYCSNDACAIIPADATTFQPRVTILYAITAHLAAINGATQSGAAGLVGHITDASEGSVSVKLDLGAIPGSASWWAQTPWGLQAWQMMAPYRTARYVPNPGRFAQIPGGAFGYGRGFGGFR